MPRNAQPTHVAVLDDDPSMRGALVRLLKAEGMVVSPHATGALLFESLAFEKPDCLILDLQMPNMSGLDVLNRLRQLALSIPTVILTAHEEAGPREACLNAGAAEYLHKPLNPTLLIQAIERILS
jgi:CheY-like chemotaxis protein